MSVPRVHVPAIDAGARVVALPPDEAHHLTRVLRLAPGSDVRVFDGRGREWRAVLSAARRGAATVELVEAVTPQREPVVAVTLAIGVLKGDQMDAVVRDATSLGVASIVPMASAHVTVPPRAWRSGAARERWTRVAIAAARQCGRAVVPEVAAVVTFEECLATLAAGSIVMAVEPARAVAGVAGAARDRPATAAVFVGPEGGWAPEEVERARGRGARLRQFGPRTIRAELMPAVVLSALWTEWGWESA
jgi:16S rRNA (uracil1498-N3)-methyltransferase